MAVDRTQDPLPVLPRRAPDGHKGDYGRVLVVGGSLGMAGAPALAAMAAHRSGAGLVTVATPRSVQPTVAAFDPCTMTVPLVEDADGCIDFANIVDFAAAARQYDVWAVGPGLGRSAGLTELVAQLYRTIPGTMVVDADGLNALAAASERNPRLWENPPGPRVLTPHPGEFERLVGARPTTPAERIDAALDFVARDPSGATVVVLKGRGSVVADATQIAVNRTGNPGMATGGTGDCLTGVIAALAAQELSAWDAARLGAHLHGAAGDVAAERLGQQSMTARDLVDALPAAFMELPR
ncbi:MAG: NAD(P)H-hydrate dehydratase [Pirellulales bacterium]|nr:NAD(P)H-hydrate dehydratase [Pirellulales bacterium]